MNIPTILQACMSFGMESAKTELCYIGRLTSLHSTFSECLDRRLPPLPDVTLTSAGAVARACSPAALLVSLSLFDEVDAFVGVETEAEPSQRNSNVSG